MNFKLSTFTRTLIENSTRVNKFDQTHKSVSQCLATIDHSSKKKYLCPLKRSIL